MNVCMHRQWLKWQGVSGDLGRGAIGVQGWGMVSERVSPPHATKGFGEAS